MELLLSNNEGIAYEEFDPRGTDDKEALLGVRSFFFFCAIKRTIREHVNRILPDSPTMHSRTQNDDVQVGRRIRALLAKIQAPLTGHAIQDGPSGTLLQAKTKVQFANLGLF
jgi:hypothetical protein